MAFLRSRNRRIKYTKSKLSEKAFRSEKWCVSPSRLKNYQKNYSLNLENRDFLSVDFDAVRRIAHISLSLASEDYKEYEVTIKDGYRVQERERNSRSPIDLSSRLAPFAKLLTQIPDPLLVRALGGNFGIPKPLSLSLSKEELRRLRVYKFYFSRNPWKLFKRYLSSRRAKEARYSQKQNFWQGLLRRLPQESFDLGAGLFLLYILNFKGYLGFAELACFSGAYGIFSGALDWLWRNRSPFIPKVAFFIAIGAVLLYWQVQYRMWAVYL